MFARQSLVVAVLLVLLATTASAGLFEDPISAVLSGGIATGESEIQVEQGSEFKLVYSENRAFLGGDIVEWDLVVVPSEGVEVFDTEEFFSGKITRFVGQEPGIFVIGLTALEEIEGGTINSYTREYKVNVTAPTSEDSENEESNSYDDSRPVNTENGKTNAQNNIESDLEASYTPDISSTENTTQETTNIEPVENSTNGSIETTIDETNGSDPKGDVVKLIILMIVVIPALYVLRKKDKI